MRTRIALALLFVMLVPCAMAEGVSGTEMISVHESFAFAQLPEGEFSATLVQGASAFDTPELAKALLGADMVMESEGMFLQNIEGEIWEKKQVRIDEFGFSYHDPMVASERGAEYEPPLLNMTREDALQMCVEQLEEMVPKEYFANLNYAQELLDRWDSGDLDRFMNEAEYAEFCARRETMRFSFGHLVDGIPVLDEGLGANSGVNGLAGFTLRWHEFIKSEETAQLMDIADAIAMASTTREAPAQLLYAYPAYSNRVSGDENFNLSWVLITDSGTYVVDCVLEKHVCDSYEY